MKQIIEGAEFIVTNRSGKTFAMKTMPEQEKIIRIKEGEYVSIDHVICEIYKQDDILRPRVICFSAGGAQRYHIEKQRTHKFRLITIPENTLFRFEDNPFVNKWHRGEKFELERIEL